MFSTHLKSTLACAIVNISRDWFWSLDIHNFTTCSNRFTTNKKLVLYLPMSQPPSPLCPYPFCSIERLWPDVITARIFVDNMARLILFLWSFWTENPTRFCVASVDTSISLGRGMIGHVEIGTWRIIPLNDYAEWLPGQQEKIGFSQHSQGFTVLPSPGILSHISSCNFCYNS